MKPMWEIKQRTDMDDVLDLYIYGDVASKDYDPSTYSVVDAETSANHLREELARHPNVQEICVYINSQGGSVLEGTAIYNQLKRHPARIIVHIDGFACSIASVIAMAGDEVVMPRNALMMIHNAWMSVAGNAAELRKAADDLDTINSAGRSAYLSKSNGKISEDSLIALMDAETWLNAEQCMAYGFADRYAEQDADMDSAKEMLENLTASLQYRIGCHRSLAAQLRQLTADVSYRSSKGADNTNKIKEMFSERSI